MQMDFLELDHEKKLRFGLLQIDVLQYLIRLELFRMGLLRKWVEILRSPYHKLQ